MRIDLHLHSTASDGTDSPTRVMESAAAAGLDVVALTDHDSTAGWAEAADAAQRLGIALVPGMELSTNADGISVHLLSYLHDPDDPALVAEQRKTRGDRVDRARRMVDRLAEDFDLTWDDVLAHTPPGATVGRPHIADAMVAKGLVPSRDKAFADALHSRSKYHVRHYSPDVAAAVRLVRAAGGVPVLAHPRAGIRGRVVSEAVIEQLAAAGLGGLEVDHRDNSPADRESLRELADRLGLFTTGSSDYHGTGKQNRIGENLTDATVLEQLEAQGRGTTVVRP